MKRLVPLLIFALLFFGCAASGLKVEYPQDRIHRIATSDGWKISLVHLEPEGKAQNAPPMILCHGLTSTAYSFDLGNGLGLGRYLADQGYDVWMLNLRGRAFSSKPGDKNSDHKFDWRIDDYIEYDVPAALDYVREKTGSDKVTWIGHSMGGMVIYGYLGKYGQDKVDKLVIIGSPVKFTPHDSFTLGVVSAGQSVFREGWGVPVHRGAILLSGYPEVMPEKIVGLIVNRDNFCDDTLCRYMANSVPDLSGSTMRQIGDWYTNDRFQSADGTTNYRENIRNITLPALVMAGKLDHVAPSWMVYPGYEMLTSKDKTFHILGQVSGCKQDHGHGGIILGDNAETEVYQVIARWLLQRQ